MVRNILPKQRGKLLLMSLDRSLTDHERIGFFMKVLESINLRGICKHSVAIVASDEDIAPYDETSGSFRARTQNDVEREERELAHKVQIAVHHALHQAETKDAAKTAAQARKIAAQAREIAALKEQLAQGCQGAGTLDASDQVHTSDLLGPDLDLEVAAIEEDASCDGSERSMTPEAFCERVQIVAGRRHWKTAFSHRIRMTMQALKADLQGDTVPRRLVAMLDTLKTDDLQPASRRHWTAEERVHLSVLLEDGLSDVELAHHLSAEFGRRIFEGSVARQRRRLQRISTRGDAGPQCRVDVDRRSVDVDRRSVDVDRRSVDASVHAAL